MIIFHSLQIYSGLHNQVITFDNECNISKLKALIRAQVLEIMFGGGGGKEKKGGRGGGGNSHINCFYRFFPNID